MSDFKKDRSIFKPFKAVAQMLKDPVTIKVPEEKHDVPESYRGFHVNDLQKCIGCGTCAEICDNLAIRMIDIPGIKPQEGKTTQRPVIDYGRCCWCALCVDICTTGSLKMTREFTHIDSNLDTFLIYPGRKTIHGEKEYELGYVLNEDMNYLDTERVEMEHVGAEERVKSFMEFVKGFTKEQALKEASRCVACGICTQTCPAHMHIPDYINAIWEEDLEESVRYIYKTNPLPGTCGRICTHKCETVCAISHRGEPIAIRWLKRYAIDNLPKDKFKEIVKKGEVIQKMNKKIAIVGSGPAGLAAAYYLIGMGYDVTIYERMPKAGGMMRYGIPAYRLPDDRLDEEIGYIVDLGVEIKYNTEVGKDIQLKDLKEQYDAVFVAVGLFGGRSTRIPGTDHENVYQAIDLLRRVRLGDEVPVEEKMVIIGGGNVAMDISRTMARLQMQKYGKVQITTCALESIETMPADKEEIEEATEEGVKIIGSRGPMEIIIENGKVKGLKTRKCLSVFDEDHRFNPTFDDSDIQIYEGSMVIEAIGQSHLDSWIPEDLREKLYAGGRRVKISEYYQTEEPWLFVGGDIVKGPDVINGVASGHQAAIGIDNYLFPKREQKDTWKP
jgi:glutamate synthase (NADPH/NADH) small chain